MMKLSFKIFIFILLSFQTVSAQSIYNAYANVTNISGSTFTVNNVNEVNHTFINGEKVIVMQMQDDVIGTNTTNASTFGTLGSMKSAGLWEVQTIASQTRVAGVLQNISFTGALVNTYTTGTNSSLQIITFHNLSAGAFTSTNNITGVAWNGNVGGVIAIEIGTIFTLNHNISGNALGYRGGAVSVNYYGGGTTCTLIDYATSSTQCGFKGEGIYKITNPNFVNGIAKALNGAGGGGQDINGAGGGGGNWTTGGNGGAGWNSTAAGCPTATSPGGQGGISLAAIIPFNRIFMGGGGGGGQQNNSASTPGGNGGGIVIVKSGTLATSGVCGSPILISANGASGAIAGNDGAGGGGAAGTIIFQVNSYSVVAACGLSITANGGNGGSITDPGTHSGGGAGAQGIIVFSGPQPTTNVTASTSNGNPGCSNNSVPCNSFAGSASGPPNSGILPSINGNLPIELLNFNAKKTDNFVTLDWATSSEIINDYFSLEKSYNGTDFTEFEKINTKAKNGISYTTLNYNSIDPAPYSGTSYYRIKQTDLNGTSKYYNIISIKFDKVKPINFSVFPNPNKGEFTVDISGVDNNKEVELNFVDISGKIIYQTNILTGFGSNSIKIIPKEKLTAGIYFCNILSEGINYPIKIIVQ